MKECSNCSPKGVTYIKYNEAHDAYYCGICLEWLEGTCNDPKCDFCPERPEKAFE